MVIAVGAGRLHLLAVPDPNLECSCRRKVISSVRTDFEDGKTEFIISFSYYYHRFTFYWEGDRENSTAIYTTKKTENQLTLGNSWREATEVNREGVFSKVCLKDEYFENAITAEQATAYIAKTEATRSTSTFMFPPGYDNVQYVTSK